MKRIIITLTLIFSATFVLFPLVLWRDTPTYLILSQASSPGESATKNTLALLYLKHIRKLHDLDREMPPIYGVLGGCSPIEPACRDTVDWLLSEGENINARAQLEDKSYTPLKPLVFNYGGD